METQNEKKHGKEESASKERHNANVTRELKVCLTDEHKNIPDMVAFKKALEKGCLIEMKPLIAGGLNCDFAFTATETKVTKNTGCRSKLTYCSSPLHFALTYKMVDVAHHLIDTGADVNFSAGSPSNNFITAVLSELLDLAGKLLDHGSEVTKDAAEFKLKFMQRKLGEMGSVQLFDRVYSAPTQEQLESFLDGVVQHDHVEVLRKKYQCYENLNQLFIHASRYGSTRCFELLLSSGSIDINYKQEQETAISSVIMPSKLAKSTHSVIFTRLTEHPKIHLNQGDLLSRALCNKRLDMFVKLLQKGTNPNEFVQMKPPISQAIISYDSDIRRLLQVLTLLLNYGANPNLKDKSGSTPLYFAMGMANEKAVQKLVSVGANPNEICRSKGPFFAPLDSHAREKQDSARLALLNHPQIALHTESDDQVSILMWVTSCGSDLMFAAIFDRCDVNYQDRFGCTPLHYAVFSGQIDRVRQLLARKANPDILNKVHLTPLMIAKLQKNSEICDLLIQHHASQTIASQAFLILAAAQQLNESVEQHLKLGATFDFSQGVLFENAKYVLIETSPCHHESLGFSNPTFLTTRDRLLWAVALEKLADDVALMFLAVAARNHSLVNILAEAGARSDIPTFKPYFTSNGPVPHTALSWARKHDYHAIVSLLESSVKNSDSDEASAKRAKTSHARSTSTKIDFFELSCGMPKTIFDHILKGLISGRKAEYWAGNRFRSNGASSSFFCGADKGKGMSK